MSDPIDDGQHFSKRHYAFALRDELPLDKSIWTVTMHYPEGRPGYNPESTACVEDNCQGDSCSLIMFSGENRDFNNAMEDLAGAVSKLTGKDERGQPTLKAGLPDRRFVAITGGPWLSGDDTHGHFSRCFSLLHDTIKSLRQATSARIPNLTIERVWPLYYVLHENEDGKRWVQQSVLVPGGNLPGNSVATEHHLATANEMLIASRREDPVELYLDFKLGAKNATYTDGDYVDASLKVAAAAELLIKHTCWMLTWEATFKTNQDPQPSAANDDKIFTKRPGELVGQVLAQRLKGSWESGTPTTPVGGWRESVARHRNKVIHRGHRPTEQEAYGAFDALMALEGHIMDRLAAQCRAYPLTALILVGPKALQQRGAWGKIRAALRDVERGPAVQEYVQWLKSRLLPEQELV